MQNNLIKPMDKLKLFIKQEDKEIDKCQDFYKNKKNINKLKNILENIMLNECLNQDYYLKSKCILES